MDVSAPASPAPAVDSPAAGSTPTASTSTAINPDLTLAPAETIKLGDHVIIYSSRNAIDSIFVTAGKGFQSRYGHYQHDKMVGLRWGSKMAATNNKGFVYLMRPTPELWTLALPHRTQILYLPDIAFITSHLDIKPGSKVIEAGTGSGSFSHSVARSVGKMGKVHSFEYHEERYNKAKIEFAAHELDEVITLRHRNVCQDGFDLTDEVDSVFLDVPAPWEAVPHALRALRKDRQARICCYSPCIEQVLKTVAALSEHGFSDITMYETLVKTHEPTNYTLPTVDEAIARIAAVEHKKEQRRAVQIDDARRRKEAKELKRKREEGAEGTAAEGEPASKVAVTEGGEVVAKAAPRAKEPRTAEASPAPAAGANGRTAGPKEPKMTTFRQGDLARGHTSYLTFAVLLPVEQADGVEAVEVVGKEAVVEALAQKAVAGVVEEVAKEAAVEEKVGEVTEEAEKVKMEE